MTASAMIWPRLSGLKNSGIGVEPAMRPRNREIWAGLPSRAVTRPSISGVGGVGDVGQAARELVHRQGGSVAGLLVAGQLGGEVTVEAAVDGVGEEVGVPEGVGHPLRGDRVLVVAGVADEGPAGAAGLAEEPLTDGRPAEALDALAGVDPVGEVRHLGERLGEGGLGAVLVAVGLVGGHDLHHQRQAVVGGERHEEPARPGVQLDAVEVDVAPVGVDVDRLGGLLVVGRRTDGAGHEGVGAVGADHDGGALLDGGAGGVPAPDADHPAVLPEQLLDGEALAHLGARLGGGVGEQRVA